HPSSFDRPETFRVAHILISTRDNATGQELTDEQKGEKKSIAQGVLERVRKGEDFTTLAKQKSEDFNTRAAGGELSFAHGQMVIEFEAGCAAVKPGQISDLVTTQFGYHIIKGLE